MEWQPGGSGFLREHIYAGPRRIAEVHTPTGQAAVVTHAHPDPAGSPALITDASGLVASREQYRPYGGKLLSPASNDSAGFAGKPFDAATGLSYMSARYYNPTLGRFISPDPVHFVEGNIHSFNRYAYANSNPMRYIDPDGRTPVHVAAAGLKALDAVITAIEVANAVQSGGVTAGLKAGAEALIGSAVPGAKTGATIAKGVDKAIDAFKGAKSTKEAAAELAKEIGHNRVSGRTAGGKQIDIDLVGKAHFDKATKTTIETPHVHTSTLNTGPNGQVNKSNQETRPATMQDVRDAKSLDAHKND